MVAIAAHVLVHGLVFVIAMLARFVNGRKLATLASAGDAFAVIAVMTRADQADAARAASTEMLPGGANRVGGLMPRE